MKYLITLILGITIFFARGQELIQLEKVGSNDKVFENKAIIYGNFIQRLGLSQRLGTGSGGFPQEIRIQDIETKEIFRFKVKPSYKETKENPFVFYIQPGKYRILDYFWTKSQLNGEIKIFIEPIYKGIDASTEDFEKELKDGKIKESELEQYEFTIEKNTINYLGTWHFDTGLVSFSDDKNQLDKKIKREYKKIGFETAITNFPK